MITSLYFESLVKNEHNKILKYFMNVIDEAITSLSKDISVSNGCDIVKKVIIYKCDFERMYGIGLTNLISDEFIDKIINSYKYEGFVVKVKRRPTKIEFLISIDDKLKDEIKKIDYSKWR